MMVSKNTSWTYSRQPDIPKKIGILVCWTGYSVEEEKQRPVEDVQGSKQPILEFIAGTTGPQHISALDFTNLPSSQSPTSQTLQHVLSDWIQNCMSGCCAFERGGMSGFSPLMPHHLSNLLSRLHQLQPLLTYHPTDPLANPHQITLWVISTREVHPNYIVTTCAAMHLSLISEDNHCVSLSYPISLPFWSIFIVERVALS